MRYGDGSKARRDTLHAEAFAELLAQLPDDEAKGFFALPLMGLSRGVRNVPTYVGAGALALPVLEGNPDHPGAAHYVYHAFDDPVHARTWQRHPAGARQATRRSPCARDRQYT